MNDRIQKIACVLHHRTIRLEFNGDRSAVDIVRVGAAVCRTLGEHCSLAVAFMVSDDLLKSLALDGKLVFKSLQR